MKQLLQLISAAGLALTIVPPIIYFNDAITRETQNGLMLVGAIIWFATAYFWLGSKWKSKS
ncbi:MAG TPA: hypothetical protein VKA10_08400 [Prolixibacteraceae bacterium]|nr:hypothetical protein [Prolixibacteraceae bacterium]